ncbi:MAG: glucan biosynthesis protein [Panacagrimonas sp.]
MKRRDVLRAGLALTAAGIPLPLALFAPPAAAALRTIGKRQAFDYAWLKGQARSMATKPYQARKNTLPAEISGLDWDAYQTLRYRDDHRAWRSDKLRFEAAFFHLGLFFKSPVHMFEVVDGQAQEIAYDAAMFDYGDSGVSGKNLPLDLGFAGFRLIFHTDPTRDVAAFLGASYFRAGGGDWQYGLSARGLAIDCGMERPEEFPDFVAYWLEKPAPGANHLVVYGLLDSPSVSGAYRFDITPGATLTMEIDAALYPRKTIERLGVAPLTSMYQTGENDRRKANDWRPEIHDSDGLAMWRGNNEWVWRPLLNPKNLRFNVYVDENPRGFGLMQRDRNFEHYQDDGVFYEKRPNVWVEPRAGWGRGSVQLVEIPTHDETFDNIVAFWCPEAPPQAGQELLYSYRLHWGTRSPVGPTLAQVMATRTGIGGVIGRPRPYYSQRFAIDFAGGDLGMLGQKAKIEPVISLSRGKVEITSARPLSSINGYRAMFDLVPPDESEKPIDIRLYLSVAGQPFSETWLYQWTPPPMSERPLT